MSRIERILNIASTAVIASAALYLLIHVIAAILGGFEVSR